MNVIGSCLLLVLLLLMIVALIILWRAEPKDEELRP